MLVIIEVLGLLLLSPVQLPALKVSPCILDLLPHFGVHILEINGEIAYTHLFILVIIVVLLITIFVIEIVLIFFLWVDHGILSFIHLVLLD